MGEDRRPGAGKYARVEREQRWLVGEVPATATRAAEITDRYITGTQLRLRRMETQHGVVLKLAQKIRTDADDPEVVKLTNIYLSEDEYAVLATLPADELSKTRWHLHLDGRTFAVDQFHGRLHGLLLAETELAPAEPLLPLPSFAIADVTNDDRYSGGALATVSDGEARALLTEA